MEKNRSLFSSSSPENNFTPPIHRRDRLNAQRNQEQLFTELNGFPLCRWSINGIEIKDPDDVRELEAALKLQPFTTIPAELWYDRESGLWGCIGGPGIGFIPPHLHLGGGDLHPLSSYLPTGSKAAARGSWMVNCQRTRVFVNGREVHAVEVEQFKALLSPSPFIIPGRYSFDALHRIYPEPPPRSSRPILSSVFVEPMSPPHPPSFFHSPPHSDDDDDDNKDDSADSVSSNSIIFLPISKTTTVSEGQPSISSFTLSSSTSAMILPSSQSSLLQETNVMAKKLTARLKVQILKVSVKKEPHDQIKLKKKMAAMLVSKSDLSEESFHSFLLSIEFGDNRWLVDQRFSNFVQFHSTLLSLMPRTIKLPKFPSKELFKRPNQQFLKVRKHRLEEYMKEVLRIPAVRCCTEALVFIGIDGEISSSPSSNTVIPKPFPENPSSPVGKQSNDNIPLFLTQINTQNWNDPILQLSDELKMAIATFYILSFKRWISIDEFASYYLSQPLLSSAVQEELNQSEPPVSPNPQPQPQPQILIPDPSDLQKILTQLLQRLMLPSGTIISIVKALNFLEVNRETSQQISESAKWMTIWLMILVGVINGGIDARLHISIQKVASFLSISDSKLQTMEMECAHLFNRRLEEMKKFYHDHQFSTERNAKIIAAAAIGGAIFLGLGIISTPLIIPVVVTGVGFVAAALPAFLGITAGLMATATTVFATVASPTLPLVFGAAGFGLGASKANKLTRGVKDFHFVPLPLDEMMFLRAEALSKKLRSKSKTSLSSSSSSSSSQNSPSPSKRKLEEEGRGEGDDDDDDHLPDFDSFEEPFTIDPLTLKVIVNSDVLTSNLSKLSEIEKQLPSFSDIPSPSPIPIPVSFLPSSSSSFSSSSPAKNISVASLSLVQSFSLDDPYKSFPSVSTTSSPEETLPFNNSPHLMEEAKMSSSQSSAILKDGYSDDESDDDEEEQEDNVDERTEFSKVEESADEEEIDLTEELIAAENIGMRICICVNGWLWKKCEIRKNFMGVRRLDPSLETYSLCWETKELQDLGRCLVTSISKVAVMGTAKYGLMAVSSFAAAAFGALTLPMLAFSLSGAIDNSWSIVNSRAKKTGRILATVLSKRVHGNRPIILVGWSLGAKVIYHCLKYLYHLNEKAKLSMPLNSIIESAFLIGGAVSTNPKTWSKIRKVVAGRLVNAYCTTDWVLASVHRGAGLTLNVAGISPVKVKGIENVDLTLIVAGHLNYKKKLPLILQVLEISRSIKTSESVSFEGTNISTDISSPEVEEVDL